MPIQSLGIIEIIGLARAVVAADICLKSANVKLVGYELSKGSGMTVIKIEGDVSAVQSSILAAKAELDKYKAVWSAKVIARPSEGIEFLIRNKETTGYDFVLPEETNEIEVVQVEKEETEETEEQIEQDATCNMCHDPKCSRKKGDLRQNCIHYDEIEE